MTNRADGIDLDQAYLIGPGAARDLGYRIDWQFNARPSAQSGIKHVEVEGDLLFALDGRNMLTCADMKRGASLWKTFVAQPLDDVYGVVYLNDLDRVYVLSDSSILEFQGSDGTLLRRQQLNSIAGTQPIRYGGYILFGGRTGEVIWHAFSAGQHWRSHRIAPSIRSNILLVGRTIVAIGENGTVAALDADAVTEIWRRKLQGGVSSDPAYADGALFVAGVHDQHLWAFNLATGDTLWRYLTESQLRVGPTAIGNRVYQFVPTEGLLCFEARPHDEYEGLKHWTAADIKGRIVAQRTSELIAWDDDSRQMCVLSYRTGAIVRQKHLPGVRHLIAPSLTSGELIAVGDDGRIIRLLPRD